MLRSVCTRLGGVTGGASSAKVCVTGVDGKVHISFPEDIERSILLRVGGPHPQTVLFEQHGAGVFVALFKLCEAGEYTLHVRRLVDNPWEVSPLPSMGNRSSWTSCAIFDERAILVQRHTLRFNGAKKPCLLGLWHYSGVNDTLHLAARDEALGEIRLAPNEKWSECTAHGPFLNVQGPQRDRSVVESDCEAAALHRLQFSHDSPTFGGWTTAHTAGACSSRRNESSLVTNYRRLCMLGDSHGLCFRSGM